MGVRVSGPVTRTPRDDLDSFEVSQPERKKEGCEGRDLRKSANEVSDVILTSK